MFLFIDFVFSKFKAVPVIVWHLAEQLKQIPWIHIYFSLKDTLLSTLSATLLVSSFIDMCRG